MADRQCKALLNNATKRTVSPTRCPFLRTKIPNTRDGLSLYCKGHRAERERMKDAGEVDETLAGDRAAPVAIRKTQTQCDLWVEEDARSWRNGDPI